MCKGLKIYSIMKNIYKSFKKICVVSCAIIFTVLIAYGAGFLHFKIIETIKDRKAKKELSLLKKEVKQLYTKIDSLENQNILFSKENKELKLQNKDLESLLDSANYALSNNNNTSNTNSNNNNNFQNKKEVSLSDIYKSDLPTKDSLKIVIENTDEIELAGMLHSITRIPTEELLEKGNLKDVANKYLDIAFSDNVYDTDRGVLPVKFSTETNSDNSPKNEKINFKPESGRIYAIFNLKDYNKGKVLIKWQNSDLKSLLLLSRYDIGTSGNNYVWLNQAKWTIGNYNVGIYSTDEDSSLLAFGQYVVSDEEQQ